MYAADPQLTAGQILRLLRNDEISIFMGAAFVTVGIISAAFSLLRRRLDPLLIWLACFAVLCGTRLWLKSGVSALIVPDSVFLDKLREIVDYMVPIPAFLFFKAAGFLGDRRQAFTYAFNGIFVALLGATIAFGPHQAFHYVNNVVIIGALLLLVTDSFRHKSPDLDFIILRRGLVIYIGFALCDNIALAIDRYPNVEPYGFVVLLGSLGYVAATQTLRRDAQLGEIQKELEVARRIQLSILPGEFPSSTSFQIAARYLPMTSVAGDFYDFLVEDRKHVGLLIADVSGHGVPAALIASMVKLAASSQRAHAAEPAQLLSGMNTLLCGNTQQQFVTAAYVHLDAEAATLRYSAAGHPPMLLLRAGQVSEIIENGLMLAAFPFASYTTVSLPLEPDDRLLLYTDGILEAADAGKEEFGQERLQDLFRQSSGLTNQETADRIVSSVKQWAVSQDDDLTVLVCDYSGKA